MSLSETLLEVHEYVNVGYKSLVAYDDWRVAILNYIDELLPERLDKMQRHDETDEVFVLLQGRCILFLGEGGEKVSQLHAVDMRPLKLYNIKRGCWHTHTLDQVARVLIIENRDTADENSPVIALDNEQRTQLVRMTQQLWQGE
jgi:ureidoglycolate hydrolase